MIRVPLGSNVDCDIADILSYTVDLSFDKISYI